MTQANEAIRWNRIRHREAGSAPIVLDEQEPTAGSNQTAEVAKRSHLISRVMQGVGHQPTIESR